MTSLWKIVRSIQKLDDLFQVSTLFNICSTIDNLK